MNEEKTVLFLCGANADYTRNALNLKALKQSFRTIEISSRLPHYFLRLPMVAIKFLLCFKIYDLIFVGFLAQPLMPIVRLWTKKPIIFDAFISLYDTICFDRKIFKPNSIVGRMAFWIDQKSCIWADKIITDTNAHADYFSQTFNISRNKFQTIYLGADTEIFYPLVNQQKNDEKKFIVFYYGSGLPLQGIDVILKAAKRLEVDNSIVFRLVGPIRKKHGELIKKLQPRNIEFIDWIPYDELPKKITESDICLGGHFSNIDKAKRVISGKTYQFLAMRKPVIVGDNPANKELFENQKDVIMVEMGTAEALAQGIQKLQKDENLRKKISKNNYSIFRAKFLNDYFKKIFSKLVDI
ncbi:glycosyltransferase [Patescibacteria group bacterium]|nr:MAG: glycosyltransferase [Patescibacteria group bacterium]